MTRGFCWHHNFVPLGCLSPTCGYILLLNHEKMCSQRLKRFFLNLQQMAIVMRPSGWHQNFGLNGLSAPAQGLCLNLFSSVTADFNISSAFRWAIQDQWSSGLGQPPYLGEELFSWLSVFIVLLLKPSLRALVFRNHLSQLARLWYFASSVKSFFKCKCAAIRWG